MVDAQGTATINESLGLTVNFNNTTQNTDDDVYSVSGAGTVSEGGANYTFTSTEPLQIMPICGLPATGKMIVKIGNTTTTTIDFYPEGGVCDEIVQMTIGNITKKVNLGS